MTIALGAVVRFTHRKLGDSVEVAVHLRKLQNAIRGKAGSQNSIIVYQVLPALRSKNPRFPSAMWADFDYEVNPDPVEIGRDGTIQPADQTPEGEQLVTTSLPPKDAPIDWDKAPDDWMYSQRWRDAWKKEAQAQREQAARKQ